MEQKQAPLTKEAITIEDISLTKEFMLRFRKNTAAMCGLIMLCILLIAAILAPLLTPYSPFIQDIPHRSLPPFTAGHILGTDDLGRDLFTRILYGGRISLFIGFFSVSIALFFGGIIGLISGYFGGLVDKFISRILDIILSFPYILLAIVIVSALGPSLVNAMIAIAITNMPRYARLMRASVLAEKEQDYVLVERSLGARNFEIMFSCILPNCLSPVMVQATLGIGSAILSTAALSFLGLGAQPPTPEWGLMIASSREFITSAWWIVTFPGLATLLTVFSFSLIGDGLRDILDPRLKD